MPKGAPIPVPAEYHKILDPLARHLLAIDVEHALANLNAIAGQADDAFYVIGRIVARQLEHRDIATLRCAVQDSAGKRRLTPGERVTAVTV